jgi:hypothetical protein
MSENNFSDGYHLNLFWPLHTELSQAAVQRQRLCACHPNRSCSYREPGLTSETVFRLVLVLYGTEVDIRHFYLGRLQCLGSTEPIKWVPRVGRGVRLTTHLRLVPRLGFSYTSTPQYVFMAWCSINHGTGLYDVIIKPRDLTFTCNSTCKSRTYIK